MWNAIVDGAMPQFWPPRPSRFWNAALEPWRRRARVLFGEPIDLSQADPTARPRIVAAETTDRLEAAIKELMLAEA